MNYAYRGWRRHWGTPSARRSGGALVWQLNDCWPTTSWAIVDYFLVKKPSFYAIKRSMASLSVNIVRAHEDWTAGHAMPPRTSKYDLWVASSKTKLASNAVLEVRFISIRTGLDSLPLKRHKIKVQPNSTTMICEGIELENPPNCDAFVIFAKLLVNGQVVSRHTDWPQPHKYFSFKNRGLSVQLQESRTRINITALRPVKGLIFSERPGLHFSDNGFDVLPGEEYSVDVTGLEDNELLEWMFLGINENQSSSKGHRSHL